MGTNYVESSLKRFLKRKVKVTLGLVVAFMITGTVGFAEEKVIVQERGENQWEWLQVKEAEKYIKDTDGVSVNGVPETTIIDGFTIKGEVKDNKLTIDIKNDAIQNKNYEIDLNKKSDEIEKHINSTLKVVSKTLADGEGVYLDTVEDTGEKTCNYISKLSADNKNIFITEGKREVKAEVKQGQIHINKGFINTGDGQIAQAAGEYTPSSNQAAKVYNLGVINGDQLARIHSQAYNYGLIIGRQFFSQDSENIKLYNYGIISKGQFAQGNDGEILNYGIAGQQVVTKKSTAYNYGTLNAKFNSTTTAQILHNINDKGGVLYNYGLILAANGQALEKYNETNNSADNSEIYNYGVINTTEVGQINTTNGGKGNNAIYNFGGIFSKKGQSISEVSDNDSALYNYGDITATKIGQEVIGKEMEGTFTNNKAYNYGTINAGAGAGQSLEKSGEIYNYGIIKADGTDYAMSVVDGADEKYNAENYGVIDISSADNAKVFKGDILNRGFVITKNGNVDTNDWNWDNTGDEWTLNRGVILNENFEVAAGTTADGEINQNVLDLTNKDNIVFDNGNIYVDDTPVFDGSDQDYKDRIHTVYMKNQTAKILGNNFDHKNILTVVDDNWNGGTIIEASLGNEDELSLFNTVITGYFTGTKGGTVMEVDSDLTLIGDTVISAIKGENVTEDVYALKLDKGINLTFVGKAQINGMIDGERGGITSAVSKEDTVYAGNIGRLRLRNANAEMLEAADIAEEDNFTDITLGKYGDLTLGTLELSFRGTADGETNNVTLNENVTVNGDINGALTVKGQGEGYDNNQINLTLNNISKISGDIYLGEYDDTITVNQKQLNEEYSKTIDGNDGNDTLAVNPFSNGENKLDYNIKNIETIELAGNWIFGDNLNVSMDGTDKDVTIKTAGTLTSYIDGNGNGSLINNGDAVLTVAGKDENNLGTVKYQMGDGFQVKDTISLSDVKFGEHSQINAPIIYSSEKTDTGAKLTLRDYSDYSFADEYKTDKYERMYDAFLGAVNDNIGDVKDKFNSFENDGQLQDLLKGTEEEAKAYYTAGYIVTKNIADTYLGVVEDFTKKARKGEWLAQAKFVNSDTEFDGGKVKGYEGDINGAVGMVEYGVSDTTSYGAVFGGGQTEVDINDGGKLDGDNYYVGGYIKHKTAGGIDILGNIGFVKSELDSELSRTLESSHPDYPEIQPGKSTELVKGTADSTAITASLLAKKDFNITDTFKLQPKLGVRYNFIKQDKAENPGMGFVIDEQDVTIFEGVVGIGAEKSMAINNGHLALNTGVDYALSNASDYNETEYLLYGKSIELEDSEIADSKGTFYIGADYEHENGVGFNAKYEMMWSDEGDDSRITAGISYRF